MEAKASNRTIIHSARIVNDGEITPGYVVIEGEFISEVGSGEAPAGLIAGCGSVIDADGRLLIPGGIDEHVHFRDPGSPIRRIWPQRVGRQLPAASHLL